MGYKVPTNLNPMSEVLPRGQYVVAYGKTMPYVLVSHGDDWDHASDRMYGAVNIMSDLKGWLRLP